MRSAWLAAACLLASTACRAPAGPAVETGGTFPLVRGLELGGAPHLVWVLRPEDYLRCTTLAREIRQLQSRYTSGLPLTIVYVGEHPEWVPGFVRRQRLDATLVTLDRGTYESVFGRRPGPWMHVLEGRRVRRAVAITNASQLDPVIIREVEQLFAGGGDRGRGNTSEQQSQETP